MRVDPAHPSSLREIPASRFSSKPYLSSAVMATQNGAAPVFGAAAT
jgi:hypothetical protein